MAAQGMRVPGERSEAIEVNPKYSLTLGVDWGLRRGRIACKASASFLGKDQDGDEDVT